MRALALLGAALLAVGAAALAVVSAAGEGAVRGTARVDGVAHAAGDGAVSVLGRGEGGQSREKGRGDESETHCRLCVEFELCWYKKECRSSAAERLV